MRNDSRRLIMLEFNELCPTLMDRFIAEGRLPNFRRLRDSSAVYTTDAEEKAPYLEPWIQWVTVHTGLSYKQHGAFDLGDGHKVAYPRLWDLVGETGRKVWICGSMNAAFRKPIDGYVLPDPWSTGIEPYPKGEFEPYVKFVRHNVHEHTREKGTATRSDQLQFVKFMIRHGMSVDTVTQIVKQLMAERGGKSRWKRAAILDRLQWDVFKLYWLRHRPTFATFFLNSTAHFQHIYWRNMDPGPFAVKPEPEQQADYAGAIAFGYEKMDEIVGKCLALAGPDTTVVLATGLSQQPYVKYEDAGGKVMYRPVDVDAFQRFVGIEGDPAFSPVMAEQFYLQFADDASAAAAARQLAALRMDGQPIFLARQKGTEVFAGCSVHVQVPSDAVITNEAGGRMRFYEQFYNCNVVKSGMHHPDGILWIRQPGVKPFVHREKVSLRHVAPTLLNIVGIPRPDYMIEPLEGLVQELEPVRNAG